MSPLTQKKMAVSFSLFAFLVLSAGSALAGATFVTALTRGLVGGCAFGLLIWAVSLGLIDKGDDNPSDAASGGDKGGNVNQVI
jgi:hypothetical protein